MPNFSHWMFGRGFFTAPAENWAGVVVMGVSRTGHNPFCWHSHLSSSGWHASTFGWGKSFHWFRVVVFSYAFRSAILRARTQPLYVIPRYAQCPSFHLQILLCPTHKSIFLFGEFNREKNVYSSVSYIHRFSLTIYEIVPGDISYKGPK